MKNAYRGNNRYQTFLKAGKIIADKISNLDGVVGILGTGSIGRRFGDRHSDLDLIVYTETKTVSKLKKLVSYGWINYRNLEYDINVISYQKAKMAKSPSAFWSQMIRWDQQNSQILYDSDDRIKNLLKEKLIYPEWEQQKLMRKYRWDIQEHLIFYPEIWRDRGNLYNIMDSLFRANESIILWLYAKNKVFEPYVAKWLFYHLETHGVPEYKYLNRLTKIYTCESNTLTKAMAIRSDLIDLCAQIGLKFDYYTSTEAWAKEAKRWQQLPKQTKRILTW